MNEEFESIMRGLQEALDDAQGKTSLKREIVQFDDIESILGESQLDSPETPDPKWSSMGHQLIGQDEFIVVVTIVWYLKASLCGGSLHMAVNIHS